VCCGRAAKNGHTLSRVTDLVHRQSMRVPDESWRVFIAIELPASVRQKLKAHIDPLRASVPDVSASWSREDNLHLTLKFPGDTPVSRIETLSQAAKRAATEVSSFELIVNGCGAFPPRGQPRVLWVGIEDPSGQLPRLHQALEEECAQAGFAREQRPFHPHLTIARLRKPHGSRQLAIKHEEIGFEAETFGVSALAVVRSELGSKGSRHTTVSRHEVWLSQSNSQE
jgi:2'-5' RNA ligase